MHEAPTERELDALMARLADGDRAAFEPLFAALRPRALRLARARLASAAGADDVAQTALLKVFSRAAEFERGRPVLPWFYAIVANEVRAATRGHVKARSVALESDELEALVRSSEREDDPERVLLAAELRTALASAVDALDAPSAEAICAVLGEGPMPAIEPPAFRKRVSRAYARLRLLLGGLYGD